MSKTVLTRVHLVNWYGFIDVIIPIAEDLTLISGENECGKSTILDAIKYAFTGDTQFNKASTGGATGIGNALILLGGQLYEKMPSLWMCWAVFMVICLIAMGIMLGMLKWLERITAQQQ